MIHTSITLDLTRRDDDAAARRRRIWAALGGVDGSTLVKITINRDAYFDDSLSLIAGLTADCDVEITGADPRYVRQYAQLLSTFQRQRQADEAGGSR